MTATLDSGTRAATPKDCSATFNRAGILSVADVQVARRLGAIGGETDEAVLLAVALVVRSTRHGSVVLDLATAQATTSADVEEDAEPPRADVPLAVAGADWVRAAPPARWSAARCGWSARACGSRGTGTRRSWSRPSCCSARRRRPTTSTAAVLTAGLDRLFVDRRGRRPARGRRVQRAQPDQRDRGRAGNRQDHDGEPAAGPAARAAPGVADRAGRADREGRRPARGGGAVVGRAAAGAGPGPARRARRRPRCTGCSAGGRTPAADSGTTAPTGCRSTSSWSMRPRWCRSR